MTPLYLITLGGITVSGKELAVVAVVIVALVAIVWFLWYRARRGA